MRLWGCFTGGSICDHTRPVVNTVERMILAMKPERRTVAHFARELRLSRQTVYEVLRRA